MKENEAESLNDLKSKRNFENDRSKMTRIRHLIGLLIVGSAGFLLEADTNPKTHIYSAETRKICMAALGAPKNPDRIQKLIIEEMLKRCVSNPAAQEAARERVDEYIRLRKKMKPFLSLASQEVINMLNAFDPEKSKILDKTFIVIDSEAMEDNEEDGEGDAKGKFRYLRHNEDGSPCEPIHLIIMRDFDAYESSHFIAYIIAHELFGHGFDKMLEETTYSNESQRYESELRARFIDNQFLEWLMAEGVIEGEIPEYYNIEIYEAYKESMKSGDWSKFKLHVLNYYVTADYIDIGVKRLVEKYGNQAHEFDLLELSNKAREVMMDYTAEKYPNLITPELPIGEEIELQ